MIYYLIEFSGGVSLLQETLDGEVLRYCDEHGATVEPPTGGARVVREIVPDFTMPPQPQEIEPAKDVPQSITRLQAKIALSQTGLLEQIQGMMAGLPSTDIQRLAWENALQFERDSAMVNGMAAAIGITQDQLDDLFIAAAAIEV